MSMKKISNLAQYFLGIIISLLICFPCQATNLENKVSLKASVGFGGRLGLSYERRISDIFALETGVEGGENFLNTRFFKLTHIGAFMASNFYFTEAKNVHQFYISPRIDISYARFLKSSDGDSIHSRAIALGASVFAGYRYLLPFHMTLEAGLGFDALATLFPLERGQTATLYSLPIPKIQLGIGYAF